MTLVLVIEFKSDCMPVFNKSLGMHIAAQERIRLTLAQTRSEGRQFSKTCSIGEIFTLLLVFVVWNGSHDCVVS